MRVLALSQVFPSRVTPGASPYLRRQCNALARSCDLTVMGVLPSFPGRSLLAPFTRWGRDFGDVPRWEEIDGIRVGHPRFLYVPRLPAVSMMAFAGSLLPALALRRSDFDVVLATWLYPDAVATVLLGHALRIPVVAQVVGTDVNSLMTDPFLRAQTRWVLPHARGLIAVSEPLARRCEQLGMGRDRIHVICTGVDRTMFYPRDRGEARRSLQLADESRVAVFVGRLMREKGIRELLAAFGALVARHPVSHLVLIGDGPLRQECEAFAGAHPGRVTVTGELDGERVAGWLAASNVLTLPSYAEGTPNVILEALSAGRRVVATSVGGIPDTVTGPELGTLIPPRDVQALERALTTALAEPYDPETVARTARIMDWDENARLVLQVLDDARR